jgi:transcriptional regulator with XRE-family HTH domain
MTFFSSGVPMVKIDGGKVRSLREVKGLTQLYLASSVEVTTDTISRWENKRYPQIKKENAIKLAGALEVPLEEILDRHDEAPVYSSEPGTSDGAPINVPPTLKESPAAPLKTFWFVVPALFIVAALGLFLLRHNFEPTSAAISAVRLAPLHTAPGQPFPVVVRIDTETEAASFIIKEMIPPQCILVGGRSPGAVVDQKSGELKWITKTKSPVIMVGYMLQTVEDFKKGETVKYSGSITQRKEQGEVNTIGGLKETSVSKYHWADTDENGMIDDEEILAVYDDYNEIDGLTLNMEQIEDIWFGSGYEWDGAKQEFVVIN